MIKDVFRNAPRNFISVFKGRNLWWHALSVALTFILVLSGADWQFFEHTRNVLYWMIFAAGIGGFFVPVVVPLVIYLWGDYRKHRRTMLLGAAVAQASAIGYLVSVIYKIFTGRTQPEFLTHYSAVDITRDFHFGILQNGIFWGWPSSHAATAFAGSVVLVLLLKRRWIRILALSYACFIGIGAAIGFHWLSDVIAGAIFGSLAGAVVAKDFARVLPD